LYLQDCDCALISHLEESAHDQLEDFSFLEGSEVPNIFKNQEAWSVEIAELKKSSDNVWFFLKTRIRPLDN
jgi:hypothetical protein